MTVGERIKARRIELGMSQEELAKKCGYKSRSSINKIELARDLPLRKAQTMAIALETDPIVLLGWDEELAQAQEAAKKAHDELFVFLDEVQRVPILTQMTSKFIKLTPAQQESILSLIDSMLPNNTP